MEDKPLENVDVKVLLVDDRIENLIALEKTLSVLNLNIFKVSSGNEALLLMLEHDFAVTLIDVMMPVMDGFEVAELMHANESTKHIPIIFVTAINKDEFYVLKGMEAGAVDYLYKPINPTILICKVKIFVDIYIMKKKLEHANDQLRAYQEQLQMQNEQLQKLSNEDSLTKIANRRAFEQKFKELLDIAKRHHRIMALFFMDIDNFKTINDQYGHDMGDFLLKTVSSRLVNSLRAEDLIGSFGDNIETSLGRLGGDEFVVVASDIGNEENASHLAERIRQNINQPVSYQEHNFKVTISIGVACFPGNGNTIEELLRAADNALYSAKEKGKNTYSVACSSSD